MIKELTDKQRKFLEWVVFSYERNHIELNDTRYLAVKRAIHNYWYESTSLIKVRLNDVLLTYREIYKQVA